MAETKKPRNRGLRSNGRRMLPAAVNNSKTEGFDTQKFELDIT